MQKNVIKSLEKAVVEQHETLKTTLQVYKDMAVDILKDELDYGDTLEFMVEKGILDKELIKRMHAIYDEYDYLLNFLKENKTICQAFNINVEILKMEI